MDVSSCKSFLFSAALLMSACQSDGSPKSVPFQPASASASLLEFRSQIYVYATEMSAGSIGYAHAPLSLYLTVKTDSAEKLAAGVPLVDSPLATLGASHGTLRIVEHMQLPRMYIVESGTVRLRQSQSGGPQGSFEVEIDAILVDPLDSSVRLHFPVPFIAPIGAISNRS